MKTKPKKNRKKFLQTLFICILSFNIFAQDSSPEVISPAGEVFNGTNIQLDWTLGELAIETIQNSNSTITQGFHQPVYLVTKIDELSENIGVVKVYPNPATDYLQLDIDLENKKKVKIELIDMNGKILWTKSVHEKTIKEEKRINDLPAGIYILHLSIENQTQNFKISKF